MNKQDTGRQTQKIGDSCYKQYNWQTYPPDLKDQAQTDSSKIF